jgi:RNA-directed DNA polymerase
VSNERNLQFAYKRAGGPINSIEELCKDVLGIELDELNQALSLLENDRYTASSIPKKDGSNRIIHNPHFKIRKIQRRINTRIFNPDVEKGSQSGVVIWPPYIFGCIPTQYRKVDGGVLAESRDYIACARVHCLAKSMLKVDIANFFDNIHIDLVKNIFLKFLGYSPEVSDVLSNLCCKGSNLVQGGLTSSYIASLALWDVEGELVKRLRRKGLRYTRLIDDITISTKRENYQFDLVKDVVVSVLHDKDLPVNDGKTQVSYAGTKPLMVHGLRVNFKEPRLPSSEISRIRANVHNVEKLSKERHYRTIHPYRKDFNRCMGRVNKLKRLGHNQHEALMKRLQSILPLPSKRDIERCKKMIKRLDEDFQKGKADTVWYWRRYNTASQRIVVIKRTFKHDAERLRAALRELKPTYRHD